MGFWFFKFSAMLQQPFNYVPAAKCFIGVLFEYPSQIWREVVVAQPFAHLGCKQAAIHGTAAIARLGAPRSCKSDEIVQFKYSSAFKGSTPTLSAVNVRAGNPAPTLSMDERNRSSTASSLNVDPVPTK